MKDGLDEDLKILVFNMMGVRFGIDVQQVDRIEKVTEYSEVGGNTFYFHSKIQCKKPMVGYQSPKLLFLKSSSEKVSMVVDVLEEILSLQIVSIRPVPKLMQKDTGTHSYWGIALVNDVPIILIDFAKLAAM